MRQRGRGQASAAVVGTPRARWAKSLRTSGDGARAGGGAAGAKVGLKAWRPTGKAEVVAEEREEATRRLMQGRQGKQEHQHKHELSHQQAEATRCLMHTPARLAVGGRWAAGGAQGSDKHTGDRDLVQMRRLLREVREQERASMGDARTPIPPAGHAWAHTLRSSQAPHLMLGGRQGRGKTALASAGAVNGSTRQGADVAASPRGLVNVKVPNVSNEAVKVSGPRPPALICI